MNSFDPFSPTLAILEEAFDQAHDQGDEAVRLRDYLRSAHYVGEYEDLERGIDMIRDVIPPEDERPHNLELLACYLYGAHLYWLLDKQLEASVEDLPEGLEAGRVAEQKLEAGDGSARGNIEDLEFSHSVGIERLTCKVMIVKFIKDSTSIARYTRNARLSADLELLKERTGLKFDFE